MIRIRVVSPKRTSSKKTSSKRNSVSRSSASRRRLHKVTHPTLGPSTWEMMWSSAEKLRATGQRVCTWCREEIRPGRRTRCGDKGCREHIWQACSWSRCRQVCLKKNRFCSCGARATEVDHVVPVSMGGLSDQNNLRGLCRECHRIATARLRREKSEYLARPREDQ